MNCPITGKICEKYQAFKVTSLKENKIEYFSVCEDCLDQIKENPSQEQQETPKIAKEKNIFCFNCGLTFEKLIQKSRLGCAECYSYFEKPLIIAFEKLQKIRNHPKNKNNELKHVGKIPYLFRKKQAQQKDPNVFLEELKEKQKNIIKEENYEMAKEIKLMIMGFESLIRNYNDNKNIPDQQKLIRDQISEFIFNYQEKYS